MLLRDVILPEPQGELVASIIGLMFHMSKYEGGKTVLYEGGGNLKRQSIAAPDTVGSMQLANKYPSFCHVTF